MSRGPITVGRTPITQPDVSSTRKGQKRFRQGDKYEPTQINTELDYIHERINQIVVEDPAIDDLDSGATLAQVITRVNLLTQTLRDAGLLKSS